MHAGVSAAAGADGVCANAPGTDEMIGGAEASVVSAARRLRGDFSNQDDFSKEDMAELPEVHAPLPGHDTRTRHIEVKSQILVRHMRRFEGQDVASSQPAGIEMPEKVLVYSRFPKALMLRIGERYDLLDAAGKPPNQMFPADQLAGIRAMITPGRTPRGRHMMDMMPRLCALICYGTGDDRVDLASATERKITSRPSPG